MQIMDSLCRFAAATHANFRARVAVGVIAGTLTSLNLGCGGGPAEEIPDTAPASGVVTYKGEPVDQAVVTFHPQGQHSNPGTGRTEANGRFVLTTYRDRDGAIPGLHVVTVELMPEGGLPGMEVESTGATPIPAHYASPGTSDLTADVKLGETNNFTFELKDK